MFVLVHSYASIKIPEGRKRDNIFMEVRHISCLTFLQKGVLLNFQFSEKSVEEATFAFLLCLNGVEACALGNCFSVLMFAPSIQFSLDQVLFYLSHQQK